MNEKELTDGFHTYNLMLIREQLDRVYISVRLNKNKRTIISIRHQKDGSLRLSMHYGLLEYAEAISEIVQFAREGGRGCFPQLDRAMQRVYQKYTPVADAPQQISEHQQRENDKIIQTPSIGKKFDFIACYQGIHQQYFPQISLPQFSWARQSARRELHSIRFGAYYRPRRKFLRRPARLARISLNPRLQYPWIARIFVEHIFHHELCHHQQYAELIRGEKSHSPRFRQWEAQYEHFTMAQQWQRLHLSQLLADPRLDKSNNVSDNQESFIE